jgi:hypothetical protein
MTNDIAYKGLKYVVIWVLVYFIIKYTSNNEMTVIDIVLVTTALTFLICIVENIMCISTGTKIPNVAQYEHMNTITAQNNQKIVTPGSGNARYNMNQQNQYRPANISRQYQYQYQDQYNDSNSSEQSSGSSEQSFDSSTPSSDLSTQSSDLSTQSSDSLSPDNNKYQNYITIDKTMRNPVYTAKNYMGDSVVLDRTNTIAAIPAVPATTKIITPAIETNTGQTNIKINVPGTMTNGAGKMFIDPDNVVVSDTDVARDNMFNAMAWPGPGSGPGPGPGPGSSYDIRNPETTARTSNPGTQCPGSWGSVTGVPGASGPVTGVPGASGPVTCVPGASGPVTGVPGASGPVTCVPGTKGPDSRSPDSRSPDSWSPGYQGNNQPPNNDKDGKNTALKWYEQAFNPRQYEGAENLDQIAVSGGRTRDDLLVNEMIYSDFNRLPPSFNDRDFEYGYSFLPPKDWYPIPVYPPVCVSNKTCPVKPVYLDTTTMDLKEWVETQKITPPDSINTTFVINELNSKY